MNAETQRRLAKLEALEAGGVDNWDGIDFALEQWRKENHVAECVSDAISEIDEVLVEAEVDQPAGVGCGHSITFDNDAMSRVLYKLLKDAQNL